MLRPGGYLALDTPNAAGVPRPASRSSSTPTTTTSTRTPRWWTSCTRAGFEILRGQGAQPGGAVGGEGHVLDAEVATGPGLFADIEDAISSATCAARPSERRRPGSQGDDRRLRRRRRRSRTTGDHRRDESPGYLERSGGRSTTRCGAGGQRATSPPTSSASSTSSSWRHSPLGGRARRCATCSGSSTPRCSSTPWCPSTRGAPAGRRSSGVCARSASGTCAT